MNCFLDRIQKWMNMCNWYSDIVLNISIWDYDNWFGIIGSVKYIFIKFVNVSSLAFFAFMICIMEKQLEKVSINLVSEEISLIQLLASITEPLIFSHCL